MTPETQQAIRAYQEQSDRPVTGGADEDLLRHMETVGHAATLKKRLARARDQHRDEVLAQRPPRRRARRRQTAPAAGRAAVAPAAQGQVLEARRPQLRKHRRAAESGVDGGRRGCGGS